MAIVRTTSGAAEARALIKRMSPGAYLPPKQEALNAPLEIFERQLRRSFAAGVERECVSFPPSQPVAGAYETAVLHLVIRTTGYVGGTPPGGLSSTAAWQCPPLGPSPVGSPWPRRRKRREPGGLPVVHRVQRLLAVLPGGEGP